MSHYMTMLHTSTTGTYRIESLSGGAYIVEADVVEQDLLHDEGGDGLGQVRPGLHDAQTERDDLGLQEEAYNFTIVHLKK